MTTYLLSPSESGLAKVFGKKAITSTLPEKKGADILSFTKQGLVGIQRKSVPHDFISSIDDGRLVRSMELLSKECKFSLMLLEGKLRYFPDGHLYISRKIMSRFTRRQIRGILFDIKYIRGVDFDFTEDLEDTAYYINWLTDWMNKDQHLGLFRRPSAKGSWYIPSSGELHSWILQSFRGIGPTTAEKMIERFGDIPIRWSCSMEELSEVHGISKAKARELYVILNGPVAEVTSQQVEGKFQTMRDKIKGS